MLRVFKVAVLIGALAAAACAQNYGAAEMSAPAGSPTEEFLIEAAATDFRTHVTRNGTDFRNVHLGVLRGDAGLSRNVLCGEYRAAGAENWAPFATIQTSPYENWLGVGATAHCTGPSTTLEVSRDLSEQLTQHYRAVQ